MAAVEVVVAEAVVMVVVLVVANLGKVLLVGAHPVRVRVASVDEYIAVMEFEI